MKLQFIALVGTLTLVVGCQDPVEYSPGVQQQTAVGNQQNSSNQAATVDTGSETEDQTAEAEAPEAPAEAPPVVENNAPQPLTNADLLAMDEVVITAVVAGQATNFYSDVGNTSVTNAQTVSNAAQLPSGQQLNAQNVLNLKAGQRMTFCNHASSTANLRVHAANGSAFGHWGNGQQLTPGQCSTGLGYPEVLGAGAVGNAPGNNLYDHNQGNANGARNGAIFINVTQ